MGGGTVTRRDFMKTTGVGAAVATGLGANIIVPGRANAAKKKLRIVQWVHFVPAYDEWFNKKYAVEWGQQNDTEVTVDNIGIAGINARAAAEVSAQKGHDLFLFNWPPPSFEEQTVDMKDVYQELERKLGMAMRTIMYSFGAHEQDAHGNLALNSPQTLEAIKFVKALFQESMTDEVYTWDASSNNRCMLAGKCSLALNAISITRVAEKDNP